MDEPTWIVLIRDVSHAVRIDGESCFVATLVLDADTGLLRGVSVDRNGASACGQAMRTALTQPAAGPPPQRPIRVLCGVGHREPVAAQLAVVLDVGPLPEVTEEISAEAEDIFDSFVGHMAGRAQPEEFADPDDWAMLVDHADTYRRAAPWRRWTDQDRFDLVKAARSGWPADADLTPVWLTTGQHGPADLDRTAVRRLTVAIAAILAHDRQPGRNGPTTGTCALSSDQQGTYTLQPH